MKDIHDLIKHAKFGDDRLRGSGVVAGQISAFPIDFAGRPYNTLTLPCERVMCFEQIKFDLIDLKGCTLTSVRYLAASVTVRIFDLLVPVNNIRYDVAYLGIF